MKADCAQILFQMQSIVQLLVMAEAAPAHHRMDMVYRASGGACRGMAGLHHLRINAACQGLWFRVWLHQPLHSACTLSMSA